MITTNQLLIGIASLAIGAALLVAVAFLSWAGWRFYLVLKDIACSIEGFSLAGVSVSKLAGTVDEFGKWTKYHAEASVKNATAVESFNSTVKEFYAQLFSSTSKDSSFQIPTPEQVDRQADINELLRANPGMDTETASILAESNNGVGVD